MENKFNYAIVGLFVIILSIAMLLIGLWLSIGFATTSYDTYQVYMNESVSGLSVNAPVKYNGVEVGMVKQISLRKSDPKQVSLVVSIEDDTPVTQYTYAMLMSQGLTGIAYIELKNDGKSMVSLQKDDDSPYPIIASKPSLMNRLDMAVDILSKNVGNAGKLLNNLLDANTQRNLKQTLQNVDTLTGNLAKSSEQLQVIMKAANTTVQNTAKASQSLPATINNINESADAMKKAAGSLATTSQAVNTQVLPTTLTTISQLNSVLLKLKGFSEDLEANPSMLVRGRTAPPAGPGE